MIDHDLESAFCAVLKVGDQLSGTHFFSGLDDEDHKLPAITIVSKSESLAGSADVFRSELEIRIEEHAHDTQPEAHAAIVGRIREVLAAKSDLLAALNAEGTIHVFGYAVSGSSQDANDEKFLTTVTLKVGCSTPAN